jgi:hypothetical protein
MFVSYGKGLKRGKLSLCLIIEAPCHEDIWANGDTAPPLLTQPQVSGQLNTLEGKSLLYPRNRMLGWLQGWSGACGVEKNFLSLLGIEPWLSSL